MKRSWILLWTLILCAALLCGCQSELGEAAVDAVLGETGTQPAEEESSGEASEEAVQTPVSADPSEEEPSWNPLCEEKPETETADMSDPNASDLSVSDSCGGGTGVSEDKIQRPYAFMVSNFSIAMPLCGVSQADWVFEMLDRPCVTKLMLLCSDPSGADRIGVIRTARDYNVEIALGYDAILIHSGESDKASAMLKTYGLAVIDDADNRYDAGTFFMDSSRQTHGTEYGLFASGAKCVSSAEGAMTYRTEHSEAYDSTYGLVFSDDAADQGEEKACSVTVTFAGGKTSSFEYSEETGTYTMFQYGEELTDNGEISVPFSNVLALYANTYPSESGELTVELKQGEGYAFIGGSVIPIRWYKDGVYDVFHFEKEDGSSLEFAEGKTYVCITQCGGYLGNIEFE